MPAELCIHVIDDDDAVRDSLSFLLDSADLPARAYDSATAFLEAIDGAGAGCVIADVQMPGMSGTELLAELESRGFTLPVVVMTGQGDAALALEARRAGAFDFIEKPCLDAQLLDCVRRALASVAPRP